MGSPQAIAAAQALLQNNQQETIGKITLSVTSAQEFADEVRRLTEVGTRVDRGGTPLASSSRAGATAQLPDGQGKDVRLGRTRLPRREFHGAGADPAAPRRSG